METGAAIINTSSINATSPSPALLAYATTKGAIANFTAGLAGLLAEKGIRVNAVAPSMVRTVDNVAAVGDGEAQYVEMQDITDGVMSLASPASTKTGEILPISPTPAGKR